MTFLLQLNIHGYQILTIPWNIFLALIPCITVYYLAKSIKNKKWKSFNNIDRASFVLLFLYWLFFFPNTAYMLMIPRHLVNYCYNWDINRICMNQSWIVIFFITYSFMGVPTFYYALKKMSLMLGKIFNPKLQIIAPLIIIPLTSIGIMLGLSSERFNSWEVVTNPVNVLKVGLSYFTNQILFFNFLIFTICLYLIYYGTDFFIKKITNS